VGEYELFTLGVAIAIVMIIGRGVANRLEVPDAIVLVVLGVLASLIPQVPNIDLSPDLVLLVFLPPLVYNAAFFSAPRETRDNAVPITALAIGATAVTILAVGGVTKLILPAAGWAGALAFASAVAPTDAVAATSVLTRLGAPTRIVTILQGESLINDGVALTAFGLAVEAMGHPFTVAHGLGRLAVVVAGGIGYGLVVGLVVGRIRHHVHDASLQVLISLVTPFVAYVPAEQLDVSGVRRPGPGSPRRAWPGWTNWPRRARSTRTPPTCTGSCSSCAWNGSAPPWAKPTATAPATPAGSAPNWSAPSATSWPSCTGAARSATRSAAPSPAPSTCKSGGYPPGG
jgi:hypothetical protein